MSPATATQHIAAPLELPMDIAPYVQATFNRVRWNFGGIPARLECRDEQEAIAYWDKMLIVMSIKYILEGKLPFVEDVSYHELGHANRLWDVPGTFTNMVHDNIMISQLVGEKWTKGMVHQFLNVVYDTIDDTLGTWEFKRDPIVSWNTIQSVEPRDLSGYTPGDDPTMEWLTAYRVALSDQAYPSFISNPVREAVEQSQDIIYKTWDNRHRVKRISELLLTLLKEQFEKEQEAMEALLAALGVGTPGTVEGGDIDEMLEGLDMDDDDVRDTAEVIIGSMLPGSNLDMEFETLWQKAGCNVRFQLECKEPVPGEMLRSGDLPWSPGMPLDQLDVVRSIERHGRFLPGITTVRPHIMEGPGKLADSPTPKRMVINCDVSGSMSSGPTCQALFTFIREAQRRRKPVAVDMFATSHHYIDFSADYRSVAERVYQNYSAAGGGNDVAGPENLVDKLQSGDLLTYITDFQLNPCDQKQAVDALNALKNKGVSVVFIAMFRHGAKSSGLSYVECPEIDNLAKLTLNTI